MSACVEYQGHRDKDGYGRQYNPRTQRQAPAHRLAYEAVHGELAPGVKVRHTCDNPPCVNPDHLIAGSQADNMQDMIDRGRLGKRRGESNHAAVLSDAEVDEVRQRYTGKRGELTALAKEYGTSRQTIKNLVAGRYRS